MRLNPPTLSFLYKHGRHLLRRSWQVDAAARQLLLEATAVLVTVRALHRTLPFPRWRRLLAPLTHSPAHPRRLPEARVERLVWAVDAASRQLPLELTCLPRAITLQILLARRRHPSEIRIGVHRDTTGEFLFHAWVESDGRILIGQDVADLDQYRILPDPETP